MRLQALTPDIDEEAILEEKRQGEIAARKELEADGCPPCYPADMEVPLKDVPSEYQGGVDWWTNWSPYGETVLTGQLRSWKQFRTQQGVVRRAYSPNGFRGYVERLNDRRKRHGLEGDAVLLQDLAQQSQLQNWYEFQNWQLKGRIVTYEPQLREACELQEAHRKAGDHEDNNEVDLQYCRRKLAQIDNLLDWIERQRRAMVEAEEARSSARDVTPTVPSLEHNPVPAAQKLPTTSRGQLRPSRTRATSKLDGQKAEKEVTSRRKNPVRNCQRTTRLASPKAKPNRRKPRTVPQKPSPRPSSGVTPPTVKTRSGRISKPPSRWVP